MRLPQTAIDPPPTPVEGLNISSMNKITKGGLRQAQNVMCKARTSDDYEKTWDNI